MDGSCDRREVAATDSQQVILLTNYPQPSIIVSYNVNQFRVSRGKLRNLPTFFLGGFVIFAPFRLVVRFRSGHVPFPPARTGVGSTRARFLLELLQRFFLIRHFGRMLFARLTLIAFRSPSAIHCSTVCPLRRSALLPPSLSSSCRSSRSFGNVFSRLQMVGRFPLVYVTPPSVP